MNLLVLGANSDIAYAVSKTFAKYERAELFLASRDVDLLKKKAEDLRIRHDVATHALFFDAGDFSSHRQFFDSLDPKPDGVVLAFGYLGSQEKAQKNFPEARHIIDTNLTACISILEIIAADFERRQQGFIIGISSVAGERGRIGNYIYGAAKGGLSIYLSGLRCRLSKKDVSVMTVLPGFVRTKMTEKLELPEKLMAEPDEVAEDIYKGFRKKKNIIYTKWFWRWIMAIIKMIPENIFKRLTI